MESSLFTRMILSALLVIALLLAGCQPTPVPGTENRATVTPGTPAPLSDTAVQSPTGVPLEVYASVAEYPAQSLCDHPYLPLRKSANWVMSTSEVVLTTEVSGVTVSDQESVAMVSRRYDTGTSYQQAWRCTAEGVYGIDVAFSSANGIPTPVVNKSHSGYYLPRGELLKQGYTWEETSISSFSSGALVTSTLRYQVLSFKPVSVNGQQFPGLQIQVTGKIAVGSEKEGMEAYQDINYLREFALGVGLVREDAMVLRRVSIPR